MKKYILFLLLSATAILGKGQATDSTNTIDWCSIFERIVASDELQRTKAVTNSEICGRQYYIIVDSVKELIPDCHCKNISLSFVDFGEMLFCNFTTFNSITAVTFNKNMIFITIMMVEETIIKKRVMFTINTNRSKGVKTKILYPKK